MAQMTVLVKSYEDEKELEVIDGRRMRVNPDDWSICCGWAPRSLLEISKNSDETFPISVLTVTTGATIKAAWIKTNK